MTTFNDLPISVQNDIKDTLKAYDKCDVWFEYGEYKVMVGACLKAVYAPDHKFIATFTKEEIFTETEQIENYINSFNCYPPKYTGRKDWAIMRKMSDEREYDPETGIIKIWQGKINEAGDFVLTHQKEYK